MAKKFGVPVCPHAGGVGLCELVQHLSIFDYVAVSGTSTSRVTEYVDHLHEHFIDPCIVETAHYRLPARRATAPRCTRRRSPSTPSRTALLGSQVPARPAARRDRLVGCSARTPRRREGAPTCGCARARDRAARARRGSPGARAASLAPLRDREIARHMRARGRATDEALDERGERRVAARARDRAVELGVGVDEAPRDRLPVTLARMPSTRRGSPVEFARARPR